MNSFLGIEMTNHQAFVLLGVLAVICLAMAACGGVMYIWGDRKFRYDYAICGCWMIVFGSLGVILFSLLGGCFK